MAESDTSTPWEYISPQDLYNLIKSSKVSGKDYIVVDVRDEDFIGGNIKGCLHIPSRKYEELFEDLCARIKDIPTIIFHCAYSQARGPKAANIYTQKRVLVSGCDGESGSKQRVLVLQGGFANMQAAYKDDNAVIEGWDKSLWEYEFF